MIFKQFFLSHKFIEFGKWIENGKTEPNTKLKKIISNSWTLLSNCFTTKTKLKVAVLSFSGSPYLYKQEFSTTNGNNSDLRTALQVKECWLKYLNKTMGKQVDCWRHQCHLQYFKLVRNFRRKFGPRWKKSLQPPIFSPNLILSLNKSQKIVKSYMKIYTMILTTVNSTTDWYC